MNELKQALQTAVEALRVLRGGGRVPPTSKAFDRAAAAIAVAEAALAQPDQDAVSAAAHDRALSLLDEQAGRIMDLEEQLAAMAAERDGLMEQVRDEMDANIELRAIGGATADEDMGTFLRRVIAERDQLRSEVERLQRGMALLTDERIRRLWLSACNDVTERLPFMAFARLLEREHSITAPFAVIDPTQGGRS